MDLRSCWAFVNNFCDRHAILMPLGWLWAWGIDCLSPFITLIVAVTMGVIQFFLGQKRDAATTRMVRMTIKAEQIEVRWIAIGILAVGIAGILILNQWRTKKMYKQAAEARAKFA